MEVKFFNELSDEQVKYIAENNYNYWKKYNPALDYNESTGNMIKMKDNVDNLPLGIALMNGNEIVGYCTLRRDRLKNHLNINPWLCNVMIFEKFRGKGYARTMIDSVSKKFKSLGYNKIYSWTDQVPEFYKKLNWKYEGKVQKNEGGEGLLFSKEI